MSILSPGSSPGPRGATLPDHPRPSILRRLREALLAIVVGVLVLFLVVELGLRGVGCYSAYEANRGDAEFTVLALGDSFTYGQGAPRGRGWPEQLEEQLDERGIDARVENRGVLSGTSTVARRAMQEALEAMEPDVAIVLVGHANYSDYRGYYSWQETDSAKGRLLEALWRIRTYRLIRFTALDIRRRSLAPEELHLLDPSELGLMPFDNCPEEEIAGSCQGEAGVLTLDACRSISRGDPASADELLGRATELDRGCTRAWELSVQSALDQDRPEQALDRLGQALRASSDPTRALDMMSMTFVSQGAAAPLASWLDQESGLPTLNAAQRAHILGRLHRSLGNFEVADEAYRVCSEDPQLGCGCSWSRVELAARQGDDAHTQRLMQGFVAHPRAGCTDFVGKLSMMCSYGFQAEALQWLRVAMDHHRGEWFPSVRAVQPCLGPQDMPRLREILARVPEQDAVERVLTEIEEGQNVGTMVEPWLHDELELIIDTLQGRDIPVILATYPNFSSINPTFREIATERGLPLADTERRFAAIWTTGARRADYFANDGNNPIERNDHCNERGYGIMAEVALEAMESAGLLPTSPK
jgi:hypothetical protein